ncbi:hypothetical protein QUB05_09970 [Microcoleus sp. F10-C6]|uniref:ISAzo13-like element transposase-related protein n=1 Tax=unclassified Microcoleus TaxID=2642155 RepID=UPI002FCE7420
MSYSNSIESEMKKFYKSLSEKDKRRYAAIEAQKLGWGGISYIMKLCGCSRNTIVQGIKDLETMNETTINNSRIRKKGGGRKSILATRSGIDEAFLEVLKFQTAGDPMNELIKWTNLTHKEIAVGLKNAGFIVSLPLISKLLKKHGFVKRKAQKKQTIGTNKNRNSQFENIAMLDTQYRKAGNPIQPF